MSARTNEPLSQRANPQQVVTTSARHETERQHATKRPSEHASTIANGRGKRQQATGAGMPSDERASRHDRTTTRRPTRASEPAKQKRAEPKGGRRTMTQDRSDRPSERTNEGTDQPTNRPARQPPAKKRSKPPTPAIPTTQESTHQPSKQPTHRRTNHTTDQRTNRPPDRPTDRPTNQPTNRPTRWQKKNLR